MSTAVVMGASRGLGLAVAQALGRAGHQLHLLARSEATLDGAVTHRIDLRDGDAIVRVFAAIGDVDVLIANAGGPRSGNFADVDEADWHDAWQLTLMSTVRAIRAVAAGMTARGRGRIVVLGSSSVRQPIDGLLLSNVYRAGVLALVKSLAPQLAPHGVTINMVSPGRILTDRVRAIDAAAAGRRGVPVQQVTEESIARIPAGRYGDPAEFAPIVAFLAGPYAGYITGQSLLVDGGMVNALP